MYADDTAFYSSSFSPIVAVQKLQHQLPTYEEYLHKWKLSANPQRSSVTVFTRRTVPPLRIPRPSRFFNAQLPIENPTRYLGIQVDSGLRFKRQIQGNINKATSLLIKLCPILVKRKTSTQNKLLFYKAIIRPAYALPLTGTDKQVTVHCTEKQTSQRSATSSGRLLMYAARPQTTPTRTRICHYTLKRCRCSRRKTPDP
ncbi:hypothetical protein Trydic_g13164 [Trypoxylus dichotomus]